MRRAMLVLATLALLAPLAAGCATPAPTQAPGATPGAAGNVVAATAPPEKPSRPNVVRTAGGVSTLDPALTYDASGIIIQACYVGLTSLDDVTNATEPGMATSWDISEDGTTYTFHLRDDVPWVRWDGKQVVKVQDCDGHDRMVTAYDFQYGILRALAPETASAYAYVLDFVMAGAWAYNGGATDDPATVGVRALDERTLEVEFLEPVVYNTGIMGLPTADATPRWVIEGDDCNEARGMRWADPEYYQSYGPFALKEWVQDSSLALVKNPFWPGCDSVPQAKVDEVVWRALTPATAMAEFEAGNLDFARVPMDELDRVKADPELSQLLTIAPTPGTTLFLFNTQAPVVDDARVRRALSMAIDRRALVEDLLRGDQQPAQWLSRPGTAGAPTLEDYPDLGAKTDVEAARKLLDEYLQEKGLTADQLDISLMTMAEPSEPLPLEEFAQYQWKSNLGLDVQVVRLDPQTSVEMLLGPEAPQIAPLPWVPDYPDTNGFLRDLVGSGGFANPADEEGNPAGCMMWKNDEFERLVREAAREQDPDARVELYAQAEQILCYEDAAIIPLYWGTRVTVAQPWLKWTSMFNQRYEKWQVLQDQ